MGKKIANWNYENSREMRAKEKNKGERGEGSKLNLAVSLALPSAASVVRCQGCSGPFPPETCAVQCPLED